jgi:hypothetical protein
VKTATAPIRAFLLVLAIVATAWLGHGCGRTSLDDGFGSATGLGGSNGSGGGGPGGVSGLGGNAGGLGGSNAPNPCGTTSCQAGTQVCCSRIQMGQPTQTCIPAASTCGGGATTACLSSANCAAGQLCCGSAFPVVSTACRSALQCAAANQAILCASNADCAPLGARCCSLTAQVAVCVSSNMPCL